jgi:AcrR family transcriptional regulator
MHIVHTVERGATRDEASPSDEAGHRARKKAATRRALRTAGLRLVLERGLHEVTVEDIASAAGVAPRTLFNYFGCKEEVLVLPGPELSRVIADRLAARPAGEPTLGSVRAVLTDLVGRIEHEPWLREEWQARTQLVERYAQELAPHQLRAFSRFEERLASAIAARRGVDTDDLDSRILASAAVAGVRTAITWWCDHQGVSLTALVAGAFDALGGGFPDPDANDPAHTTRRA